jgi:hypothetical protein
VDGSSWTFVVAVNTSLRAPMRAVIVSSTTIAGWSVAPS